MTITEHQRYIESEEWAAVKASMRGHRPYACVGCGRDKFLHLHHMIYPPDIWQTRREHCCWLCDRCHEVFHRAPAKYIALATTEGWTRLVIKAQREEEEANFDMSWMKSSISLRKAGLKL